jgi:hypothetical protein
MAEPPISHEERKQIQAYMRSEFDALIREPERTIHHYTNGAAAARIVDQARLRATNILFLNDGVELGYAVDAFRAAMKERTQGPASPDRQRIYRSIDRYLAHVSGDMPPDVWVITFTEQRDTEAHWRTYGRGTGVALGFSPEGMIRAAEAGGAVLLPCCYDDRIKIGIMSRGLALIEQLYAQRNGRRTDGVDSGEALVRSVIREIALFSALMKPAALAEEREWRVVLVNATQTAAGARAINAVAMPEYMSLAVDLPLADADDRLPLTEIVVGPGRQQRLTERAFRTLLYKNGYERVAVMPSGGGPGAAAIPTG